MLRLASYDIVFQEIPGEVTLALNLSECPNRCAGCHSPHLRESVGMPLDEELLAGLLADYGSAVTCVCFMGGDGDPGRVNELCAWLRGQRDGRLKTGWYSGCSDLADGIELSNFDFIKLGPYVEQLGGLRSETTNQRLYRIEQGKMTDITDLFHKKNGL